jgi:hypothetical protein
MAGTHGHLEPVGQAPLGTHETLKVLPTKCEGVVVLFQFILMEYCTGKCIPSEGTTLFLPFTALFLHYPGTFINLPKRLFMHS